MQSGIWIMSADKISRLVISTDYDFNNYAMLLDKAPESMVYQTKGYVDFIASYLQAEAYYLALKQGDRLLAAIPIVLKKNQKFGNIINSNPYYGSNGGIIVHPDLTPVGKNKVKSTLLEFLADFAKEQGSILTTIIASSLDRDQMFYRQNMRFDYLDRRVGQITVIPHVGKAENIRNSLFENRFSSGCRRAIRKAEKTGVTVKITSDKGEALDQFYEIYRQNIQSKAGMVKDKDFFEKAFDVFPDNVCNLRYAELNGRVIAGIFQLYFKDTVEYFQPAIHHDYRDSGATNLLVFHGMEQAAKEGYIYWNFGGTWESQEDVYNFKHSFGAVDFIYYYFIASYGDLSQIKRMTPQDLKKEYPGFFVLPYSALSTA
jgi:hypothetical protein